MRIVLDTSALVSGFLRNGTPRRLIEAATAQKIELFTTETLIAELDDDHVLACALAARAEIVVSRDPHLLNLKHYQDIPILDPAQALLRIAQSTDG